MLHRIIGLAPFPVYVLNSTEKGGSMEFLNMSDVLNFAIRIEEMGELFYKKAALLAKDDEAANTFYRLAEEEVRHKEVFANMLSRVGNQRPPESYPGEYLKYVRSFIDGKVVFKDDVTLGESGAVVDTRSALDYALQRELDSILFYHELKQLVPEGQREVLEEVIAEERRHFQVLSLLRQKYN